MNPNQPPPGDSKPPYPIVTANPSDAPTAPPPAPPHPAPAHAPQPPYPPQAPAPVQNYVPDNQPVKEYDPSAKPQQGMTVPGVPPPPPAPGGGTQTVVQNIHVMNAPTEQNVAVPASTVVVYQSSGCNVYWVLFVLGIFLSPLFCCCGAFGIASDDPGEKTAGKANLIGAIIYGILWIIVLIAVAS